MTTRARSGEKPLRTRRTIDAPRDPAPHASLSVVFTSAVNSAGARAQGIRCIDVFQAIVDTLRVHLSPAEQARLIPRDRARWDEHWHRRCRAAGGLTEVEAKTPRRVDLLEGRRIFMGLRRPLEEDGKPDSYWLLELGLPNDAPR